MNRTITNDYFPAPVRDLLDGLLEQRLLGLEGSISEFKYAPEKYRAQLTDARATYSALTELRESLRADPGTGILGREELDDLHRLVQDSYTFTKSQLETRARRLHQVATDPEQADHVHGLLNSIGNTRRRLDSVRGLRQAVERAIAVLEG